MAIMAGILFLWIFVLSAASPVYACPSCMMSILGNTFITAFIPVIIVFPLLSFLLARIFPEYYPKLRKAIFVLASISFIILLALAFINFEDIRSLLFHSRTVILPPLVSDLYNFMYTVSKPGFGDGVSSFVLALILIVLLRMKKMWQDFSYAKFSLMFLILVIGVFPIMAGFYGQDCMFPVLAMVLFTILVSVKIGDKKAIEDKKDDKVDIENGGPVEDQKGEKNVPDKDDEEFYRACKILAIWVLILGSFTLGNICCIPLFLAQKISKSKNMSEFLSEKTPSEKEPVGEEEGKKENS